MILKEIIMDMKISLEEYEVVGILFRRPVMLLVISISCLQIHRQSSF